MTAARIILSLESLDLTGGDADAAARMGFLEWAFTDAEFVTPDMAEAALRAPEAQNPCSDAARAFVGFLRQASLKLSHPRARSGRARRLH